MSMDRPAFPASLPSRSSSQQLSPKPLLLNTAPRASSTGTSDSLGAVKIVLGFLIVAVLGNLALTIYMTRPKDLVEDTTATIKANSAVEDVAKLRSELDRLRYQASQSTNELNRLKVDYMTVCNRLAAVNGPRADVHGAAPAPEKGNDKK